MNRFTGTYALLQSFYWVSASFVYAFAERFLTAYGFSVSHVGLILAAANIAALFLQPFLAGLTDRENGPSLKSTLFACLSAAIVFAALLLFPGEPLALIAVLFISLSTVTLTIQPMVNSVGLYYVDRNEPLNYSLARGIASLSFAIFTYIAGYLAEWRTDSLLWCYIISSAALMAVCLGFAPKKTAPSVKTEQALGTGALLKAHPHLILFLIGVILTYTMHNYINAYMLSIVETVGCGTLEMSVAIALAAFLEIPSMAGFPVLQKKFRLKSLLLFSFAAFVVKHLLLLVPLFIGGGIVWVYLSQVMQLFGYAVFILASSFWINRQMDEHNKVKGQMLITEAITVGCILGQLLGGFSITKLGVPVTTLIGTVLSVFGLLFLYASLKTEPKTE